MLSPHCDFRDSCQLFFPIFSTHLSSHACSFILVMFLLLCITLPSKIPLGSGKVPFCVIFFDIKYWTYLALFNKKRATPVGLINSNFTALSLLTFHVCNEDIRYYLLSLLYLSSYSLYRSTAVKALASEQDHLNQSLEVPPSLYHEWWCFQNSPN